MNIYKIQMFTDFFEQCMSVEKELYKNMDNCCCNRRGYVISPETIYTKAILRPAKSFYYADGEQILRAIRNYKCNSENKGAPMMLRRKELVRIFNKLKSENPNLKSIEIATIIDDMPAPRFYISVSYAKTIFYKMYEQNNRKVHQRESSPVNGY